MPNKRGALFLKNHLAQTFAQTIWLPEIISAEELIVELSGLKTLEEIDLLCHLYESYKISYGENAETFDSFAKWGQLILQDFNEIDRYLADSEQLYENLKDIKVIENWSLGEEPLSEYQVNYLKFMNSLGAVYKHFSAFLVSNKWAYQGLAYKHAVLNQDNNEYLLQFDKLIFCGFNALNAAELKIFHKLFIQKKADVLWDADVYYLNNPNQEAGSFLRANLNLFKEREPLYIQDNFKEKKDIKIVSVPKQVGQAQVVKQTLQHFVKEGIALDKVAVVLANEKLLWPVLQQLPSEIEHVNITMEYPLRYTSTYSFIDALIQIQLNFEKQTRNEKTIYHNDLIGLFRQPLFLFYIKAKQFELNVSSLTEQIITRNLSFVSQKNLRQLLGEHYEALQRMFQPTLSIPDFCALIQDILQTGMMYFLNQQRNNQSSLELEYLQIILKNFNRLEDIITRYPHFNSVLAFKQLYTQVVGHATAPFIGEPLKGLQIMGVLETRTLDFEYVILVNVNEGVLPSGKTINSFIPNDLKRAFGLPLYLEKDAVYAYHFYRLLQKAKDITITYDSETDTFGKGEKSRFVTQLQLELQHYNPEISITEAVASYPAFPEELKNTITIHKNEALLSAIRKKAGSNDLYHGLSPSGLITYKECPLKFYFRYGAGLKETKEVEDNAEANTFGSILHVSLETLYSSFTGKVIAAEALAEKLKLTDEVVNKSFISFFDNNEPAGKSILQQEVIKVYVKKLINSDIHFIHNLNGQNQVLSLHSLEKEFSVPLEIETGGDIKTVYLKGKIDRVDSFKGQMRIVDYKSSVKESDKFVFSGFETLFCDKNYNKQLQLFLYAWLLYKSEAVVPEKLMPCVIPFKVFLQEPKYILDESKTPFVFSTVFFEEFERELKSFIASIFNTAVPFIQTEDEKTHEYCPYNVICNFK